MGRLEGQILAYMHGVRQVRGLLMRGSKVDHRIVQLDQLRQPAHGNRRVSKGPGSNVLLPKTPPLPGPA